MDAEGDDDNLSENEGNWSDENGIKKRKRKSTTQIKLLKQELDGEMNWTKEKIVQMAKMTGLSQSQVYKWCWDQKKKQNKNKEEHYKSLLDRRKLIKKDLSYRGKMPKYEDYEDSYEKEKLVPSYQDIQTKIKSGLNKIEDHGAETEKKIKKRLVFS